MQVLFGLVRFIYFDVELSGIRCQGVHILNLKERLELTHLFTLFIFESLVYAGGKYALELMMIRAAFVK